jgi:multidrug resistance efflux pump
MRRMRNSQTPIAAVMVNAIIYGAVISELGNGWIQPVGAAPVTDTSPRPVPGVTSDKSSSDCRQSRRPGATREALETLRTAEVHYQRVQTLAAQGAISQSVVLQAQADYQQALERVQDNGDRSELKARLTLAKSDYERMQLLYNEGAVTRSQMLQTQQTYQKLLRDYQRVRVPVCDRSK